MLSGILIYYILGITFFTLGLQEWIVTKRAFLRDGIYRKKWSIYTYLLLFLFVLISSLRYRTGVDCESYVYDYLHWNPNDVDDKWELFYVGIVEGLRSIGAGRVLFLGVLAALEIVPFYYALKTRKFLYAYIGLILMVGPFYLNWMNGIRQCIAACFFVLASVVLVDKWKNRRLVAALIIILAAQFHTSAYVLLAFLFIPAERDLFKNRILNIAILIVCAVLGQSEFIKDSLGFITAIEHADFYSNYNLDLVMADERTMTFGPRRIVIFLLCLIVLWYAPQMKRYFNDKFFIYSFNLFFINECFGDNLLSNVSHVLRRPFLYTQPFELICFAYFFYYISRCYKGKYKNLVYIFSIILICSYIFIQCYADAPLKGESSLFKFYLGQ